MSTIENTRDAFKPAFCNRGSDCKADPAQPFCAACGADIAGYLNALTGSHEPVGVDPHGQVTVSMPTVEPELLVVRHAPAAPQPAPASVQLDPDTGDGGDGDGWWRDRLIIAAFAV